MATNNRTADVILRYQVDSASVNRVRASFTAMDNELDDLRASLTGVGTAAQQGVNGLRTRFAQGAASVESMQDEVEQLRRELLRLDDLKVTPTVDVQRAGGGSIRGGGGLEAADRVGTIGSQIAGGFGNSELGNVVGLVGDAANSLTTLGVAGGAAALAVGGLSLAINELKRIADEAKASEAARLQGEIAGEALAGSPAAALKARTLELINQITANDEALAERRQEISDLTTQNLSADLVEAQVYYGRIAAINDEIIRLQNANTTALGEFVEVSGQYQAQIANQRAIADTLQTVNERYGPAIRNVLEFGDGVLALGRNAADARERLAGLQPLLDGIGAFVEKQRNAAADARAALQTEKTDSYLASITQTVQAQEALTKAQNAYAEAVAASEVRIAEIGRKLQDDLSAAETDRQNDLAEAARQAGEERVKATEDAEKERARIQKRFDKSFAQAVGDRDALAAKRAEEQRDDELDQLDDRYKDQLKTVDKSLAQQQRVIEARYQQQVATINAAAQAAVRTEQAAAQARLSALQQGVQAAQVALINAQQAEYLIRANFYNQAVSQAQVWANLMQLYTAYGFRAPTASPTPGSYGGGSGVRVLPTPLADGGPAYANRPYLVGEQGPELFVPAQSGRIVPNGAAFTINVQGAQMDTIRAVSRQQAITAFGRVLDQMGVA
jgi:hypothetical protein